MAHLRIQLLLNRDYGPSQIPARYLLEPYPTEEQYWSA
jgi:hypothetical protein